MCKCVLFVQRYMDYERLFALRLSVSQFHSAHSVLSFHSCISNQAYLCSNDMLHQVQSSSGLAFYEEFGLEPTVTTLDSILILVR